MTLAFSPTLYTPDVRSILRALANGEATHSLAAFWKHHPLADQSAEGLAAATLEWQAATGSAIVKLTPAGNYQVAQRGLDEDWCGDGLGRRTIRGRAVHQPQDWATLPLGTTALETAIVGAAGRVRVALGPEPVLLASVFSPVTQALMLAGPAVLQQHLLECPQRVLAALERLTADTLDLIGQYAAAGVDGIYYASQHHEQSLLPAALYLRHGAAFDRMALAAAERFDCNVLHVHGHGVHLHGLPEPGHWLVHYELGAHNPDPAAFRRISACPVVPGLPVSELAANNDTLRASCRRWLHAFGQRSALFTAACVVPLEVPVAEVRRWVDTIRQPGLV